MSAVDKTEKRKFATKLRALGTAATIRENVVKDLRENSVLVRSIEYAPLYTFFRMRSSSVQQWFPSFSIGSYYMFEC